MKKIIAVFLILATIISGCSLFKKDPQKAVNEGVFEFADVKKMSSRMTLSGTIQTRAAEKPSNVQFALTASGMSDMSDVDSPTIDMKFELSASLDNQTGRGTLLFRTIDKKSYFNLEKLELPGEAGASFTTQLTSVLNTWWVLPTGENNPLGSFTDEQKNIQEQLKTNVLFTNATLEGEEMVEGEDAMKYRIELHKDALQKIIVNIARITENQFTLEEETALADSLKDIEFSGAVWIGDDDIMHRIAGTIAIQPTAGPSSSFDIDYRAWGYGKKVEAIAPESPKDFNPLIMLPLFGALSTFNQTEAAVGTATTPIDNPLGASQAL